MSKQLYSPRFILKIQSNRLRENDWSLNINLKEARDKEELIQLGDSQTLRFIRELTNNNYTEEEIKGVKEEINKLKKEKSCKSNKNKMKFSFILMYIFTNTWFRVVKTMTFISAS